MIGYLKGKIVKSDVGTVIIDVNGVGYKVSISSDIAKNLVKGEPVELFVHTHVKEDAISLFGFKTEEGLRMFELLISVSGVGPKTALAILVQMKPEEVQNTISLAKVSEFTKIAGVGKKVAQKIIVELQSKIGSRSELNLKEGQRDAELLDALTNLGFDSKEAQKLSENIDPDLSISEKLKLSLKAKR